MVFAELVVEPVEVAELAGVDVVDRVASGLVVFPALLVVGPELAFELAELAELVEPVGPVVPVVVALAELDAGLAGGLAVELAVERVVPAPVPVVPVVPVAEHDAEHVAEFVDPLAVGRVEASALASWFSWVAP